MDINMHYNKVCLHAFFLRIYLKMHIWLIVCPNPYELQQSWECTFWKALMGCIGSLAQLVILKPVSEE